MTAQTTPRTLYLDGPWDFTHESGVKGTAQVPGPWQAQFPSLRWSMGRATYARSFQAPALAPDEIAILHFGAVSERATVRVNGVQIGSHEGGYLPFDLPLPPGLLQPENRVEVDCHLPTGE